MSKTALLSLVTDLRAADRPAFAERVAALAVAICHAWLQRRQVAVRALIVEDAHPLHKALEAGAGSLRLRPHQKGDHQHHRAK
jgi:hypothetical protein